MNPVRKSYGRNSIGMGNTTTTVSSSSSSQNKSTAPTVQTLTTKSLALVTAKAQKSHNKTLQKPKVTKYASKYLESILDQLIDQHVQGAHHPKIVGKWLHKMRSNILKQVSGASKTAFITNDQNEHFLETEIQSLQESITSRMQRLTSLHTENRLLRPAPYQGANDERVYNQGDYEVEVSDVQNKVKRLANLVGETKTKAEGSMQSMEDTVISIGQSAIVQHAPPPPPILSSSSSSSQPVVPPPLPPMASSRGGGGSVGSGGSGHSNQQGGRSLLQQQRGGGGGGGMGNNNNNNNYQQKRDPLQGMADHLQKNY